MVKRHSLSRALSTLTTFRILRISPSNEGDRHHMAKCSLRILTSLFTSGFAAPGSDGKPSHVDHEGSHEDNIFKHVARMHEPSRIHCCELPPMWREVTPYYGARPRMHST